MKMMVDEPSTLMHPADEIVGMVFGVGRIDQSSHVIVSQKDIDIQI